MAKKIKIGSVVAVTGLAAVQTKGEAPAPLKPGVEVFLDDVINTPKGVYAQINFIDGSYCVVKPESFVAMKNFGEHFGADKGSTKNLSVQKNFKEWFDTYSPLKPDVFSVSLYLRDKKNKTLKVNIKGFTGDRIDIPNCFNSFLTSTYPEMMIIAFVAQAAKATRTVTYDRDLIKITAEGVDSGVTEEELSEEEPEEVDWMYEDTVIVPPQQEGEVKVEAPAPASESDGAGVREIVEIPQEEEEEEEPEPEPEEPIIEEVPEVPEIPEEPAPPPEEPEDQPPPPPDADLAVEIDYDQGFDNNASGWIDHGEEVIFTVEVTNNGPDAVDNVSVNIPLESWFVYSSDDTGNYNQGTGFWNVGALANGETQELNLSVIMDMTELPLGAYPAFPGDYIEIPQVATVESNAIDPNPLNDNDEAGVDPDYTNLEVTNEIVFSDVDGPVGYVEYEITVKNLGDASWNDAYDLKLIDSFLAGNGIPPSGLVYEYVGPSRGTYDEGTGIWYTTADPPGPPPAILILEAGEETTLNLEFFVYFDDLELDYLEGFANSAMILESSTYDPWTSNNVDTVWFYPENIFVGTSSVDNFVGDAGGVEYDRFVFTNEDIQPGPLTDTISNFTVGGGEDTLDLGDLLEGVSPLSAANLDNYLTFTINGSDTDLTIDLDPPSGTEHIIKFIGVDLFADTGTGTNIALIQDLLNDGNLDVENP